MPAAPQPDAFADDLSPAAAAAAWHTELYGSAPTQQAVAPATWPAIGEHVDHAGGVVIMNIAQQRAAVAVSPRDDQQFHIHFRRTALGDDSPHAAENTVVSVSSSIDEVAELFSQQQPDIDETGKPTTPPLPRGGLAQRLGGIVWMMIQRQLLSRETGGMNIVVVSAITPESGLGEDAAIDAALALALQSDAADVNDAPLRARLAEVCAQAGELFSGTVTLRARYSTALRGAGTQVAVIDYADGSLTTAVHPVSRDLAAFAVTVPHNNGENSTPALPEQSDEIRRRNRFVDSARQAFGAQSLRLLPDAPARVTQWLAAVHQVNGTDGFPELHEARTWLDFHATETERAQRFAHALRSQRARDIWTLLQASQQAMQQDYALDAAAELAQLCQVRGAISARAAAAGTSRAVIAYVDKKKAANFASDLAADGLVVTQLLPGEIAQVV